MKSKDRKINQRGFALVAAMLLLILVSAVAVTLVYQTNDESRIGSADLQNGLANYAAEAAMEKMANDISTLFSTIQAPLPADITALSANPPSLGANVTYIEYSLVPATNPGGTVLAPTSHQIISGPNAGLMAEIEDITLSATALMAGSNEQVRMTRKVEVALIPVFQFGVFSNSSLSYHAGANFSFAGRVHTNGNLFIAENACCTLTFQDKISAVGDIVRQKLDNGVATTPGFTGNVFLPTADPGCNPNTLTNCRQLALTEGSVVAGPGSGATGNWQQISKTFYNGLLINDNPPPGTGATPLVLPFTKAGIPPIALIKQPAPGESLTSAAGQSRLYNQAQIRVILADTPADLPGGAQGGDVQLENTVAPFTKNGIAVTGVVNPQFTPAYFAAGLLNTAGAPANGFDPDWTFVPPAGSTTTTTATSFPLIGGWLRVEARQANGAFTNVTQEWLSQGFARGLQTPDIEHNVPLTNNRLNNVHPNAILILQQQADRNLDGQIANVGPIVEQIPLPVTSNSQYNWYPINLYDNREGSPRDTPPNPVDDSCYVGGIMNAVELDVNNLNRWLAGAIGATGKNTENQSQNGYMLYFSDRRGVLVDPNPDPALNPAGIKQGDYGFNDVTNVLSAPGIPNGQLDPGEDIFGDGHFENYGAKNVGNGFQVNTAAAPPNPYQLLPGACQQAGRKYRVTGARHAIKLINGSLGNVPTKPDLTGGFTVASEQPVYVQGNYNASDAVGFGTALNPPAPHSASAIIADSVTMLSNNWTDVASFTSPRTLGKPPAGAGACPANATLASVAPASVASPARIACNTFWRVAIAEGKTVSFPQPAWSVSGDDGTDGGIHNFLRFLEGWGGNGTATANYMGSMVSFFYSQYATGVFKCCNTVYSPPNRAYAFDQDFLNPTKLPPGTPRLIDVVNLSSTQDFTPH